MNICSIATTLGTKIIKNFCNFGDKIGPKTLNISVPLLGMKHKTFGHKGVWAWYFLHSNEVPRLELKYMSPNS